MKTCPFGVLFLVLCALFVGGTLPAQFEESRLDKAKKYLDDAVFYYEIGENIKAKARLQNILDMDLNSTETIELMEAPGFGKVSLMMDVEGLEDTARALLEKTIGSADNLRKDPSHIRRMVKLLDGTMFEKEKGARELKKSGIHAVPVVVKDLVVESDPSRRALCHMAVQAIGRLAVPALTEALKVKDPVAKFAVIKALEELDDVRAAPALKAVADEMENPEEIRDAAKRALEFILEVSFSEMKPAQEYYRELAEGYYRADELTQPPLYGDAQPIWWWDEENRSLVEVKVPTRLYGDKMAEKLCFEGLKAGRGFRPLYVLLCKAYFSEGSKARAEDEQKIIDDIMILGALCGKEAILEALEQMYDEKRGGESLVFAYYTISKFTELSRPPATEITTRYRMILKGLDYPDPRVRLAAAETLVAIEPRKEFEASEKVIPILACEFNKSREGYRILIVGREQPYVNRLKGYLRGAGHEVMESLEWQEGLRMAFGPPAPDVVILAEEYEELYGLLRTDYRTRFSSIIILLDEKKLLRARDKYRDKARVEGKEITEQALLAAINDSVTKANPRDLLSRKDNANRAADALLKIDPATSPFDIRLMAGELRASLLQARPEALKMKALRILRRIGTPEDIATLLQLLTTEGLSDALKAEACNVLGNILSGMEKKPSKEIVDTIVSLLQSDDLELRMAASRAFGEGNFELPRRFEVLEAIDKESSRGERNEELGNRN